MEAIRQYLKVKNNQLNIILPDDFTADEVEVIILPSKQTSYDLNDKEVEILENRLNEPESEYITSKESLKKIKDKYGF